MDMPKQLQPSLLRSVDAKLRMRWTRQLHERFANAVSQLGGADKASPKSVMRVMGIPGLTLYHLKSHLQKYRSARARLDHNRDGAALDAEDNLAEEQYEQSSSVLVIPYLNLTIHFHFIFSLNLKTQMEAEGNLQEQIEVQRHLQLRIEAQGKYLQSVLELAEETLMELVAAAETEHATSSLSGDRRGRDGEYSTESCLTCNSDVQDPMLASSDGDAGDGGLEEDTTSGEPRQLWDLDLNG